MLKLLTPYLATVALAFLVSPLEMSRALAQQTRVTIADIYPTGTPPALGAVMLQNELQRRLSWQVNLLPAGQGGGSPAVVAGVASGSFQIGIVPTQALATLDPNFGVFTLPFLFQDLGHVLRFADAGEGRQLLQSLENRNLAGLAYWPFGMVQLFTRTPVREAGDLRGKKITLLSPVGADTLATAWGATMLTVAAADLFPSIQTGAVDAAATTPYVAVSQRLAEVLRFVDVTNQQSSGAVLIANPGFWRGLSAETRALVLAVVQDVTREVDRQAVEQVSNQLQLLRRQGMELVLPNAKVRETWRETAQANWSKSGVSGAVIQAALAGGAEGGGDPCPADQCRCVNRTCSQDCCSRPGKM